MTARRDPASCGEQCGELFAGRAHKTTTGFRVRARGTILYAATSVAAPPRAAG